MIPLFPAILNYTQNLDRYTFSPGTTNHINYPSNLSLLSTPYSTFLLLTFLPPLAIFPCFSNAFCSFCFAFFSSFSFFLCFFMASFFSRAAVSPEASARAFSAFIAASTRAFCRAAVRKTSFGSWPSRKPDTAMLRRT